MGLFHKPDAKQSPGYIVDRLWYFLVRAESDRALEILENCQGLSLKEELNQRWCHGNPALDQTTILMMAACSAAVGGHPQAGDPRFEVVRALLAAGADPNAKDKEGRGALSYATYDQSDEVVKLLLSAGAEVNAKADSGETPLVQAVMHRNAAATRCLLAHGADPFVTNPKGHTLIQILANRLATDVPGEIYQHDVATAREWLHSVFSPEAKRFKTASAAARRWNEVPEVFRQDYGDTLISPLLRRLHPLPPALKRQPKGYKPQAGGLA